MRTFWQFLESNFVQVNPETQQGLSNITQQAYQMVQSGQANDGQIGQIPFTDHKGQSRPIPIFFDSKLRSLGKYDPNIHRILINPSSMARIQPSNLLNILSHELTHAVDPKFHPDMPDAYFDKGVDRGQFDSSRLAYEKSPHEFDAFGGGMANVIRQQYASLNAQQKPQFINDFERWLKYGGEIPKALQHSATSVEAMQTWFSKPTLWRKFQQRMFGLIQELKNQQTTPNQQTPTFFQNTNQNDPYHPANLYGQQLNQTS